MSGVDDTALIAAAQAVLARAYAKYSGFSVGAAVLSAQGQVYAGCNVENIAFPLGTCAERSAIAAAVAAEGPRFRLARLAVIAEAKGVAQPCTPCGACRQVMLEFGGDAVVLFRGADLTLQTRTVRALLPEAFSF